MREVRDLHQGKTRDGRAFENADATHHPAHPEVLA
jgi:hypothetical protein